jgi:hypothetical protein
MSITGAVNDQASAYPAGGSTCARSGTAPAHHGSSVGRCSTSVPGSIRTPVSSSSASRANAAYPCCDHAVTRSCGSAL